MGHAFAFASFIIMGTPVPTSRWAVAPAIFVVFGLRLVRYNIPWWSLPLRFIGVVVVFGHATILASRDSRNADLNVRGVAVTTMLLPSSLPTPAYPRPLRLTCAEFHRFGDMGMFEGRQAMLIDGVILEQGPMNPPQAITLGLVEEAIRLAFWIGWWLRQQLPLVLDLDTDPEPDVAVVPGRPRDYAGHPSTADLLVEVADSSLSFDTHEKRLL